MICPKTVKVTGKVSNEMMVICQEIDNIIARIPMTMVVEVMICDIDWLREVAMVSISFVTRERISPLE